MITADYVNKMVATAIAEDVGSGDITANLLPNYKKVTATIITRESAVICGIDFANEVYHQLDPTIQIAWKVKDGEAVIANQTLCTLAGLAKPLLTGERVALNFLQTLSGTATTTRRYVNALKNSSTQILDTRKTIPGLRMAQKYAVRCGGGTNHRMGLFDAFLIKENHIEACGSIENAIKSAKHQAPGKLIEIEVENLIQLQAALSQDADIILLDNFAPELLTEAVSLNKGRAKLEVSGNVSEEQLAKIAATGVDYISIGALTKHIRAIDLSMRVKA